MMDCSPINPGGDYYIPNTVQNHCNWAFNNYYMLYRGKLGTSACALGTVSELVPPSVVNEEFFKTYSNESLIEDIFTVFPLELACERHIRM